MFVTAPSLSSPLAPDNCHKVQFSCQLRERLCKTFIAQRSSLVQAPSDETLRHCVCRICRLVITLHHYITPSRKGLNNLNPTKWGSEITILVKYKSQKRTLFYMDLDI